MRETTKIVLTEIFIFYSLLHVLAIVFSILLTRKNFFPVILHINNNPAPLWSIFKSSY
jgi:hypothetical protein